MGLWAHLHIGSRINNLSYGSGGKTLVGFLPHLRLQSSEGKRRRPLGEMEDDEPKFPAFPYEPYSIQVDFMKALYRFLNKGGVSMLESPTGEAYSHFLFGFGKKGG